MIRLYDTARALRGGVLGAQPGERGLTMAEQILARHNAGDPQNLRVTFDALASHDITYVGVIQTARASGMTKFPLPYVLTNCHNSLCAVGGTINEDDHAFGLSAAQKYGGVYVPAHQAVIHQYMREMYASPGKMILGSDSHTRYGALGCMGVGEGGPELVKQLLCDTWDAPMPEIVAVRLSGAPRRGVGPMDVALTLIAATFKDGFVKNRVLEFFGEGVSSLSVEYRMGIDVMTTETACLSSVWETDDKVRAYLALHGREDEYKPLSPGEGATYDRAIEINLSEIEPMIALPFHPSNALPIREFLKDPAPHLAQCEKAAEKMLPNPPSLQLKIRDGSVWADQAEIAGCAGGMYENLCAAADMLKGKSLGAGNLTMSVYPASAPMLSALIADGAAGELVSFGATLRSPFCGPCFGAGDVPRQGALSLRHATRNFPSREGSRPSDGQLAYVALMDARSIAATCANGGRITPADECEYEARAHTYAFTPAPYRARVYDGWGKALPDTQLVLGPNITDWPEMPRLADNLLLYVASSILDPVTTTDELIPSGETSSYRSNPVRLAQFALSRRDPGYVGRAKEIKALEARRAKGEDAIPELFALVGANRKDTSLASLVFAIRPGDGSAREQAASCQRVLGGAANVCQEYATKRYRSNVVNWGMLPFVKPDAQTDPLAEGDWLYLPHIRESVEKGDTEIAATLVRGGKKRKIALLLRGVTEEEKRVLLAGCLMNERRGR